MRPLVIDTNVVVAGLITRASDSPVRHILDGMLTGAFPFALSEDLLAEYRRVLLRPTIRKLHGLSTDQVGVVLTRIVLNAQIRDTTGQQAPGAPDRGDDHLWQLLHASPGATLVTGDRRLIERPPDIASVISPRAAMEALHR